jgi:hypothetical protein
VVGVDYTDFRSLTNGSFDITGINGAPVNVYRWDRNDSPVFGERFVTFDSTRRQKSIYGAGRFQLSDTLKLIVGGKLLDYDSDYITKTTAGYDTNSPSSERRKFTPYAGLVYELNPTHTLYASFATIYNPQTSLDRRGNLLAPQEGNTYEAGVKSSFLEGRLTSSAAVYQIRQDNLAEPDEGYFVPGTTTTASRVVKGAKTPGHRPGTQRCTHARLEPDGLVQLQRVKGCDRPAHQHHLPSPDGAAVGPPTACLATGAGSRWAAAWSGTAASPTPGKPGKSNAPSPRARAPMPSPV